MIQINGKNFNDKSIFLDSWGQFKNKFFAPKRLFKYFSNTTTIINDEEINYSHEHLKTSIPYMVDPTNFNDPFDCNIAMCPDVYKKEFLNKLVFNISNFNVKEFTEMKELIELFYINNSFFSANMSGFLKKKIEEILLLTFYYLAGPIQKQAEELGKKFLDDSNIELINEKFFKNLTYKDNNFYLSELLIPKDELLIAFNKSTSYILDKDLKHDLLFFKSFFKVSCFTSKNDSCLMWSHYANEHKGFCVEYYIEENDVNLLPVIYNTERKQLEKEVLEQVDSFIRSNTTWKIMRDSLLTKSIEWSYENEWRLFSPEKNSNTEVTLKIKAVYFGCNMKLEDQNKIIEILTNLKNNIEIYKVNLSPTKFLMNPTFLKKI